MELKLPINKYLNAINSVSLTKDIGRVTQVNGFLIRGFVPGTSVGSICEINSSNGQTSFLAEVVGFEDRQVLLMPLGEMQGVGLGSKIVLLKSQAKVSVGDELLGRVINGLGEPIDGKGDIDVEDDFPLYSENINPLSRPPIHDSLHLGVRAIDGLLTLGKGQRVGILAGSGVGKSMLLGMVAKNTQADVNVIALIGERGREVREFIENSLGEEGLKKSVVIAATSDQSPLVRMRGAFVATAIAEYFCRQNKDVLLMMDSVTRFAMAQREIGLNVGEPPTSKGYTPSVFSIMPKLLERAGTFDGAGSITGLYSVLVEGDDMDEPIADAVRSIVDGHVVLSRSLAQRGHFPAIDILQSNSRVMHNVVPLEQLEMAQEMRGLLAEYRDAEDLINIGAYKEGANPKIDRAIQLNDSLKSFLKQKVNETTDANETIPFMMNSLGYGGGQE